MRRPSLKPLAARIATMCERKSSHIAHAGAHSLYFLAVAIEGHGLYAMVGGALLIWSMGELIVAGAEALWGDLG